RPGINWGFIMMIQGYFWKAGPGGQLRKEMDTSWRTFQGRLAHICATE
ncbi:hypothetical protein NPIL_39841, partial [Nephila pilipes]